MIEIVHVGRRAPPTGLRAGITLVEILIVTMLVGIAVPALTASISRQAQLSDRAMRREMAVQLAQEATELVLNGGFYHWWGIVRPTIAPLPPSTLYPLDTYQYSPNGPFPYADSVDVSLTVRAVGNALTDDPFNPFVGSSAATRAPWSNFRREYTIRSRHGKSRVLACTVKVWFGPDDAADFVSVPIYLADHPKQENWRGIVWIDLNEQMSTLNAQQPEPGPIAAAACIPPPAPRELWGKPSSGARDLLNPLFPVPDALAPGGFGYPR